MNFYLGREGEGNISDKKLHAKNRTNTETQFIRSVKKVDTNCNLFGA